MKIADLSQKELTHQLKHKGIYLQTGPFTVHVKTRLESVAYGIHRLYADHTLADSDDFADFHIALKRADGIRRWIRPQVVFSFDGFKPFKPLPLEQAFPMFEWAFNWCIANHSNQYLILHAACIEKNGHVAILPGPPGAGKSTLCATLVHNGWRLLSDELALFNITTGKMHALARPVNLKNDSINIIKQYIPQAIMGRTTADTVKGTVAHMKAPEASVTKMNELAEPRWIIFPRYRAASSAAMKPRSKACTFIFTAENSFNYSDLGDIGFEMVEQLINKTDCFDFSYSSLDEAVKLFNKLDGAQ